MTFNFHGKRVLVAEDNYLIANELAEHLEAANAVVLGPCASLADANLQALHSDLAVLDVDLRGEMVFPLADRLKALDVPFVFFTGYDRILLPPRFANVDCITKPLPALDAVKQLDVCAREMEAVSVVELIPMLRVHARELMSDPAAADRLVEVTLRMAIDDPEPLPMLSDIGPWLTSIMERAVRSGRGRLFN